MKKIMFVCHGNICRSPMAEYLLRDMLEKAGIRDVKVSSCATSTEEIWNGIGNPVYPPVKRLLEARGINCDEKRAVQLKKSDYGEYDAFFVMDSNNLRNALRILCGDPEGKVRKLMELTGKNEDVSDPWYTRDFEATERDLSAACEVLVKLLK